MIETIRLDAKCLRSPWNIHTVYVAKASSVNPPVFLSNGCDFLSQCEECSRCCAIITRMFENGYTPIPGQITVPDISLFD